MNPALLKLIRLQARGVIRKTTRGAATPRRAIFTIFGIGIIVLWLGSVLLSSALGRGHSHGVERSPERFREVMPAALLGICLMTIVSSAGDKAIAFTPGEVDMLFPGPYTRRELLFYKLLKSVMLSMLTALLLSFGLRIYSRLWVACWIGSFLSLIFVQFFSTAGVLLAQAVGERAKSLGRRAGIVLLIVAAAAVSRHAVADRGGVAGALRALRYSQLGQNVLAPFEPFAQTITAYGPSDLAAGAGEAAAIDLGLLLVVVLLDANYVEAALAASRRRYAMVQRIRAGSLLSSGVKGEISWRLPRLPWAGGAGPIVWRQATSAARSARGLLLLLVIVGLAIGPLLAPVLQGEDTNRILLGAVAWLTILLASLLKFDFRGDLDHMEELKTLPIRPSALAIGQVAVPATVLTVAHVLLLSSVAFFIPTHRQVLIVAAFMALPFNALLMSVENLIFLMFPSRPAAASPGDFQVLGRQAAQLLMKGIAVMCGLAIALGFAAPLFIISEGSYVLLTIVAASVLAIQAALLIPAIAWAFARFDPSVDLPA